MDAGGLPARLSAPGRRRRGAALPAVSGQRGGLAGAVRVGRRPPQRGRAARRAASALAC